MIKCKKSIFLVFGYLLIVAVLFVPYASWSIVEQYGGTATTQEFEYRVAEAHRKSPPKVGFMFTPIFIYKQLFDRKKVLDYNFYLITNHKVRYSLLITEFAIIILFGGFAYILFCVALRKNRKPTSNHKE